MRNYTAPFLGIVTFVWLIGGTLWFKQNYTNKAPQTLFPTDRSSAALASQSVKNSEIATDYFSPLNLHFKTRRANFKLSSELHTYFQELQRYLTNNKKVRVSVAVYSAKKESDFLINRRLKFLRRLAKTEGLDMSRFVFLRAMRPSEGLSRVEFREWAL
jgi:hypothetical protein